MCLWGTCTLFRVNCHASRNSVYKMEEREDRRWTKSFCSIRRSPSAKGAQLRSTNRNPLCNTIVVIGHALGSATWCWNVTINASLYTFARHFSKDFFFYLFRNRTRRAFTVTISNDIDCRNHTQQASPKRSTESRFWRPYPHKG